MQGKHLTAGLKPRGRIHFKLFDKDGKLKEERRISNLIVNAGLAAGAGLLNGVVTNFFEYVAIGTGTTAPAAGDTALGTEITTGGGARAAATTSLTTTTVTNDTARWVITFNFTATFAVTESGIFDSATAGTMLARQTFSAINVVSGDSLQLTWDVSLS